MYLSIRTVLSVAFNAIPLTLIILVDAKLNVNIYPMTGHKLPHGQ